MLEIQPAVSLRYLLMTNKNNRNVTVIMSENQHPEQRYVFQQLSGSAARLVKAVSLENSYGLAVWNNARDEASYIRPEHCTLSCYLSGGYGVRCQQQGKEYRGGGPGKIFLFAEQHQSDWLIDDPVQMLHFYFDTDHLRQLAEKTLDRDGRGIQLDDHMFADDQRLSTICRDLMLPLDWHDNADKLALSSAGQLLLLHVLKSHTSISDGKLPSVRGGLSPSISRRLKDYIEENLDQPLTIAGLAEQAGLSEYHFARMFRQSMTMTPHQYVMERRLKKARFMLQHTASTLIDITVQCGFSSQSHFSRRFREKFSVSPGLYRRHA